MKKQTSQKIKLHIRLYIAAGVQFLIGMFLPFVLLEFNPDIPGMVNGNIMLVFIACAAICFFSGEAVREQMKKNPNYGSPKFYKALPTYGNMFVLAAVCFVISIILQSNEITLAAFPFNLGFEGFLIAGIVLAVKHRNRIRKFEKISTPSPTVTVRPVGGNSTVVPVRPCSSCGTDLNKLPTKDIVNLYGKGYCAACAERIRQEQKMSKRKQCAVCQKSFAIGDLIMVDGSYYCEDCFHKRYD